MSMNLLESVTGLLTPDLIGKAASMLGESESGITKAVSAIGPAVLQSVLSNASKDNGAGILDMAKQAAGSGVLDNLGGLFGNGGNSAMMNLGTSLLSGLFGNKTSGIANLVASFAGIKSSSSNSLLSAVAPMALGLIGKQVIGNNLSAGGLLSWLTSQKEGINKAIPSGFNLSSVLGGDFGKVTESARASFREPVVAPPTGGLPKWLLPLLLLALAALALWYFLKGCNNGDGVAAKIDSVKTEVSSAMDTAVSKTIETVKEAFKVSLPGGVSIDALKGGVEDKLVTCLNDPACKPGKDLWFDFDNINFETASAKITSESQVQVNNIAAILKAYPAVKVKIGGYTDKVGKEENNKKLSLDRAAAVTEAIKAAGANATQLLSPEGYGSEFAKEAVDASDEARKKDRRIAVSVREK